MINQKTTYRLICIFIAMIAFLFALHPHQAIADPINEAAEEEKIDQDSYLMLSTKEYRKLEQKYKQWLELYASNKMTSDELSLKFAIFSKAQGLEPRFDEWVNAFPNSYSARLARGIYRVTAAWENRGIKFSSDTTDAQFRRFGERLKEAQTDLEFSLQLFSHPVESYRFLIRISKGLGLGTERNLLDAASKLEPRAFEPRHEYLISITPKWGGNKELMARFLEESNKSPMSDKHKNRLEGHYYFYLAEQAYYEKNYKIATDYYFKSYIFDKSTSTLYSSGKAALDGDFKELAFERFDQLANKHPKYAYGFEQRGYLYETHFKDYVKAVDDYLVASELGDSWAQNRMGWYYMMGIYVPVDYFKAKYYLDLAAKQGNETAKANLAVLEKLRSR